MATDTKPRMATVWILTQNGRERLGHTDAARAWEEHKQLPPMSHERITANLDFNPVEINIRPGDVYLAVHKWEKVADQAGVCIVEYHDKPRWERYNEVYV